MTFMEFGVALTSATLLSVVSICQAMAEPGEDALVNSACTHEQAVAAIDATNPDYAAKFHANATIQRLLRNFIAMGPDERRASLDSARGSSMWEECGGPILAAADICTSY